MAKLEGGKDVSLVQIAVTLIVALIAFVGGIKANEISKKNTEATIASTKEENLKQFRREPQQYDRYAAVLKEATALRNRGLFTLAALTNPDDPNSFHYSIVLRPGPAVLHPDPDRPPPGPGPTTIEDVHGPWQDAYTALAQAVSEAEIAASDRTIAAARALRDKYRDAYRQSILSQIDDVRMRLNARFDYPADEDLAEALVGVPANPLPPPNQADLMKKTVDQLTQDYRDAVKADLGL
jgi:hypothetical protein